MLTTREMATGVTMRTTIELLNEAKRRRGLRSDYALGKALGCNPSYVSRWMKGRVTLGEEHALQLAELLGEDAGRILIELAAERAARANRTELAAAWRQLARSAAIAFCAVFLGVALPVPRVTASTGTDAPIATTAYYVNRRFRRWLQALGLDADSAIAP